MRRGATRAHPPRRAPRALSRSVARHVARRVLALCALLGVAHAARNSTRMNFVFMFPDTLRAEAFSTYGNSLLTTPHLDAFAKTGVTFANTHVLHTQAANQACHKSE